MKFFDLAKKTAKIVGSAAVVGAGIVKDGAENLYDTVQEDRAKLAEIKSINEKINALVSDFEEQRKNFERDFGREHEEYIKLAEKINGQFETFDGLQLFMIDKGGDVKRQINSGAENYIGADVESLDNAADVSPYMKGGAAGLAAGASAVGLMTAFGTAGTGAALSGLTGSAYIHATLAALGGGTLASGGFGMVGGAVVLGATILAPALAVTGYFTDKQIKSAYLDAKKREKNFKTIKAQSSSILNNLKNGVEIFRKINMEIYNFSRFFDELLNMSPAAQAMQKTESYWRILKNAAEVLIGYEKLSPVTADGKINENISLEIEAAGNSAEKCRNLFYEYRASLSPAHQSILEELKNQKLINDKLQSEIQWQKDNQPQNYIVRNETIRHEYDKALVESEVELDIISAWMNFFVVDRAMKSKFEQLLKRGVTIKILYGIGDMTPETTDARNKKTLSVARQLQERFADYPNFKMKCTNTHQKLFICDEKFYVNSSLNILSFSGDYSGTDKREEGGEASNNVKLIREYR